MKTFKLVIVYKSKKIEEEASQLVVNTENGQLTILANHLPIITTIKKGKLEWISNNKKQYVNVEDGLLRVNRNEVIAFANFD